MLHVGATVTRHSIVWHGLQEGYQEWPTMCMLCFQAMFSKPVPQLACQLNAWVTALTCQWLMGPCKVNDLELADGTVRPKQGVLVERYLGPDLHGAYPPPARRGPPGPYQTAVLLPKHLSACSKQ